MIRLIFKFNDSPGELESKSEKTAAKLKLDTTVEDRSQIDILKFSIPLPVWTVPPRVEKSFWETVFWLWLHKYWFLLENSSHQSEKEHEILYSNGIFILVLGSYFFKINIVFGDFYLVYVLYLFWSFCFQTFSKLILKFYRFSTDFTQI